MEESVLGWKEFELEVMRDHADTVVVITSIENLDPMGVHTGDSITVAPAQTLSDVEYQRMRDAAKAVIREIGVDTGGSNIQFALHPKTGRMVVIEMNPRVSRSSALASKATGFPIAKIAALLAVGYRLDELPNDITRKTPASFEPTIDYVVVKIPRFAFEKFQDLPNTLGELKDELSTQMKSVGEVMAIGRTFKEALLKALRGLERDVRALAGVRTGELEKKLYPNPDRIHAVLELLRRGMPVEAIHEATRIDPWFLHQMKEVVEAEEWLRTHPPKDREDFRFYKALGLPDRRIGELLGKGEREVRAERKALGVAPVYKTVDTCAAEFEAYTPYHYSTYELEDEVWPSEKPKVVILGSGPIRIGQGVEFDYATVHAVWALKEEGFETIMVNSNPETVSTDYDTADRLYFEPLTLEDVLNLVEHERPLGVIATLGGQTPLKLARGLEEAGVRLLGTPYSAIHQAEDREAFHALCRRLGIPQPEGRVAQTPEEALRLAEEVGFPLLARPSYVLGGRAMRVLGSPEELRRYLEEVYEPLQERPSILLDRYLEGAVELDVDALSDGEEVMVAGVMEHVERAGVHSGDSATVLPPVHVPGKALEKVRDYTRRLALALGVRGLLNVQYAVLGEEVYVLEANPRASRTVPFVSKAIGIPLAKLAAKIALGKRLRELGVRDLDPTPPYALQKLVAHRGLLLQGQVGLEVQKLQDLRRLAHRAILVHAEVAGLGVVHHDGAGGVLGVQLEALREAHPHPVEAHEPVQLGLVGEVRAGGVAEGVAGPLVALLEELAEVGGVPVGDPPHLPHPLVPVLRQGLGHLHAEAVDEEVVLVGPGLEEGLGLSGRGLPHGDQLDPKDVPRPLRKASGGIQASSSPRASAKRGRK